MLATPTPLTTTPVVNFEILWETTSHSWYGQRCHVIRQNGTVVRGIVCHIVFGHHHWGLRCRYFCRGKLKTKTVSPLALLWTQLMWHDAAILSEEEEEQTTDSAALTQLEEVYDIKEPVLSGGSHRPIPYTELTVDTTQFPPQYGGLVRSVNWKLREVALFQQMNMNR